MNKCTKICFLFLCVTLVSNPLLSCGSKNENQAENNSANQEWRIITDMKGNKVKIPKTLSRVALLGGTTGQIAYLLGIQNKLCAVTSSIKLSRLAQEMDPLIKNIPAPRTVNGNINIEELILSNPELVIAGDIDGDIVKRKTNFTVAYLQSGMNVGFNAIKTEVKFYANVFNKQDRANRFIEYLDKMIIMVTSRVKDIPMHQKKSVYNGYQKNHLVTIGGDSFLQEFIETAGCRNAAKEVSTLAGKKEDLHQGLGLVSMEQVISWDPDIIVVNMENADDIYQDSRWMKIKAVKNKVIYRQPTGLFILDRPTAESSYIYTLWIAMTAYPERFRDINIINEIKKFYKDLFDFQLSENQAKDVLNGSYAKSMQKGLK
jgi:iron complex transport system substrate-binding protein